MFVIEQNSSGMLIFFSVKFLGLGFFSFPKHEVANYDDKMDNY